MMPRLVAEQSESILKRISSGRMRELIDERFHEETLVRVRHRSPGARAQVQGRRCNANVHITNTVDGLSGRRVYEFGSRKMVHPREGPPFSIQCTAHASEHCGAVEV